MVSKKLGKAVRRNKIKRRIREATRLRFEHISPGYDLVFIARQRAAQATYQQLAASVEALARRANLWRDNPHAGDGPQPKLSNPATVTQRMTEPAGSTAVEPDTEC
ncbi:MAG: hypothetical protein Kow0031_19840 [Anaerolineae bacterium]